MSDKITVTDHYNQRMFDIGQRIFLKIDPEQIERMVTGIVVRPNGIMYEVSSGVEVSTHYDIEMSSEVDVLTQLGKLN